MRERLMNHCPKVEIADGVGICEAAAEDDTAVGAGDWIFTFSSLELL